jgi:hypothetical protein
LRAFETSVFVLTSWAEIQHTPNRREVRHEDPARGSGSRPSSFYDFYINLFCRDRTLFHFPNPGAARHG